MKVAGIIVEYNPLHNGHVYHINKTKELTNCDVLIGVMSGSFNQRGIPSIIDKWSKTSTALHSGVDLVIELPVAYSVSSAEFFSYGAVSLLNSLGIVDSICFGSEYGEVELLKGIAQILNNEPLEFKNSLKHKLKEGQVYPKARTHALLEYLSNSSTPSNIDTNFDATSLELLLNSSNNILGIEYIKSLLKLKSSINIHTIKRLGASYNSKELDSMFSSATSIRKFLKESTDLKNLSSHLPTYVFNLLLKLYENKYPFTFDEMMFPYIKYKALLQHRNLKNIPDVSEGLDNKIIDELRKNFNYKSAIEQMKSKRYTYTRISRILCQYFIGFDCYDTAYLRSLPCPYARILGFNEKGKSILKAIKNNSSIPMYTKMPKSSNETLSLDIQATRAYSLINPKIDFNDDYLISPLIVK